MKPADHDLDLDLERSLSAVQARIDRERGLVARLRSLGTPARLALAGAGIAAAFALAIALTGNWRLLGEAASGARPILLIGYVVVLWSIVRAALRPMHRIESVTWARGLAAAGIVLPFIAAMVPLHENHEIPGESGYCVILGAALAVLLVVLLKALDRGAHENRRSALLAVASAAMASNLALEFHCPITRPEHRLAFHASVGVAVSLGYLLVLYRWSKTRKAEPSA